MCVAVGRGEGLCLCCVWHALVREELAAGRHERRGMLRIRSPPDGRRLALVERIAAMVAIFVDSCAVKGGLKRSGIGDETRHIERERLFEDGHGGGLALVAWGRVAGHRVAYHRLGEQLVLVA